MNKRRAQFFLVAILTAFSLFFLLERGVLPGFSLKLSPQKSFKILGSVISLIREDYVNKPNPSRTMEGAYKGMVGSLDVLSGYLSPASLELFKQQNDIAMKETGIILYKTFGSYPAVIGVIENSPADKSGIEVGQYISEINNNPTLSMSMLEANLALKDRTSSLVNIKILKMDMHEEIEIEKAQLFEEMFSFTPEKKTSGILKVHRLHSSFTERVKDKILPLLDSQKKPMILDLRNCHEGEIEESRKFINLFLHSDKIGHFEKKKKITEILSCPDEPVLERLPLIIWTNQATIGASEVIAGVLKKYKEAKIIGFPTLGLTAKKELYLLSDESGLILTSSVFHISEDDEVWNTGIKPDVKLKAKDLSTEAYLQETYKLFL
jgi:C-terminal peptidase prc